MIKLTQKKSRGNTGINVAPIIYGTSYLGNLYAEIPEETKLEIVRKWFECTGRPVVIDSAGKYGAGLALEIIGRLLDREKIDPADVIISNKLGWYRVPLKTSEPTFEPGAWVGIHHDAVQKISYEGILDCWSQGRQLLGNKYQAAMLSVHDPDEYLQASSSAADRQKRLKDILEAYRALFELKDQGRVKAIGIGSKDWLVIKELSGLLDFDWVMIANKFTLYHHPKEIVEFMEQLYQKGSGIINSAVFNAGFLTGGSFFDYVRVGEEDPAYADLFRWRKKFHEICRNFGVNPSAACIKFGISHPAITGIALNTSQPGKMEENVRIILSDLPAGFWKALKDNGIIDPEYKYV